MLMEHALALEYEQINVTALDPAFQAYLNAVYLVPCKSDTDHRVRQPTRGRLQKIPDQLFFFYLARMPARLRPKSPALLGLNGRHARHLNFSTSTVDVYRAVPQVLHGAHGLWSGRELGDPYFQMCFEGNGGLCSPSSQSWRANATLWLYPFAHGRDESSLAPLHGFASFSQVEVFHCAERSPSEAEDYWMYLAVGSGIAFALGRTIAFRNRLELFRWANATRSPLVQGCWFTGRDRNGIREVRLHSETLSTSGYHCPTVQSLAHQLYSSWERAAGRLLALGFESLQLTRSEEHAVYKFEIVDLRQHQPATIKRGWHQAIDESTGMPRWLRYRTTRPASRACPRAGAARHFSHGLEGKLPCRCDEGISSCLNCGNTTAVLTGRGC